MRRTPLPRALAGLAAGVSLVATLSACAAKPQDSNTSNGVTPGPPLPAGISYPTLEPLPTKSLTGTGADCAFCAILRDEVPAEIVYADALCVAFLDHRPLFHGHVLLVPREHMTTLAELPTEAVGPYMIVAQRLERAVESAMASDGSLILVNNVVSQSVPHLHLHVIPRKFKDGLRFWLGPRVKYGADLSISETGQRIRDALTALG